MALNSPTSAAAMITAAASGLGIMTCDGDIVLCYWRSVAAAPAAGIPPRRSKPVWKVLIPPHQICRSRRGKVYKRGNRGLRSGPHRTFNRRAGSRRPIKPGASLTFSTKRRGPSRKMSAGELCRRSSPEIGGRWRGRSAALRASKSGSLIAGHEGPCAAPRPESQPTSGASIYGRPPNAESECLRRNRSSSMTCGLRRRGEVHGQTARQSC